MIQQRPTPSSGSALPDGLAAAVSGLIRQVRRTADLSQRDLAERALVGKSSVARAERGDANISLAMFLRLIEAAGFTMAVVDDDDRHLPPMRSDAFTDHAGRYYPAHLDSRSTSVLERVAGLHRDRPVPRLSFEMRLHRDERRRGLRTVDHPVQTDLIDHLDSDL